MYLSCWFGSLQCTSVDIWPVVLVAYVSCWWSLTSFYSFWKADTFVHCYNSNPAIVTCAFSVFLYIVVFPIVDCIVLCLIVLIVFWIIRHLCLTDASQGIRHITLLARCKETTKEGTGSFLLLSSFLDIFSKCKSVYSSSVGEQSCLWWTNLSDELM